MAGQQAPQHQRDLSFHVTFPPQEVARVAKEVLDGTIADVHLSLLIFWIMESREHYEEAKQHIRELGLDQGYQTARIENLHLRKLLEETHSLRPRYDYAEEPVDPFHDLSRYLHRWPPRHLSLRAPSIASNESSAPYFASSPITRAQIQPRSATPTMSSGKWPVRSGSLPSSINRSSPERDFPPNTPDRPAPLNIRPRGCSSAASATQTTQIAVVRSTSSPLNLRRRPRSALPPSTVLETMDIFTTLPQGNQDIDTSTSEYTTESEDLHEDQYRFLGGTNNLHSLISGADDEIYFLPKKEEATAPAPAFQPLGEQDAQTEVVSITETDATATTQSMFERHTHSVLDNLIDPFESLPDYMSSSSQGTRPNSEYLGSSQGRSRCTIPNQRSQLHAFTTGPAPSPSQRRAAVQARRAARHTGILNNPSKSTGSIDHPLPFRALADPDPDPTLKSPSDSSRIKPLEAKGELAPSRRYEIPALNGTSSSRLDHTVSLRRHDSDVTLPSFRRHPVRSATQPIPTRLGNNDRVGGVGEMAMRIGPNALPSSSRLPSRMNLHNISAGTRTPALSRAPSTSNIKFPTATSVSVPTEAPTTTTTALGAAFQSMSSAYITSLLDKTRTRGALLPTVRRSDLDPFEISWRDVNEDLITTIYGRKEVAIPEAERELIDRVARNLREGAGKLEAHGWVGPMLRNN